MSKKVMGNDPFGDKGKPSRLKAVKSQSPSKSKRSKTATGENIRPTVLQSKPAASLEASMLKLFRDPGKDDTSLRIISGSNETKIKPANPEYLEQLIEKKLSEKFGAMESRINDTFRKLEEQLSESLTQSRVPTAELEKLQEEIRNLTRVSEKKLLNIVDKMQPDIKIGEPDTSPDSGLFRWVMEFLGEFGRLSSLRFYQEIWSLIQMRSTSDEVDDFGYDPGFEEKMTGIFDFLYTKWWRIEVSGIENLPLDGRGLLVGNHSGTLPWDGMMVKMAVQREHPKQRIARPLIENFIYYFPYGGTFLSKIGGVRASQENAQRLLLRDELVLVFPEGVKGLGKYYRDRYKLQRFGRGGFIKLAMKTSSPIIPTAVMGAEEIHPLVTKADWIARLIGMPYFPITPTMPWLGLAGLIPLPTKWHIQFGKPIDIGSSYSPDDTENDILVNRLSEHVRNVIQDQIYELLKTRKSIWFG